MNISDIQALFQTYLLQPWFAGAYLLVMLAIVASSLVRRQIALRRIDHEFFALRTLATRVETELDVLRRDHRERTRRELSAQSPPVAHSESEKRLTAEIEKTQGTILAVAAKSGHITFLQFLFSNALTIALFVGSTIVACS